jgi:NADH-quinone oxidoreductase subunit I
MKADDPAVRWIDEPELGLAGKLYLTPILDGLAITARHFFRTVTGQGMTRQFPEERPVFGNPLIYRGVHRLNKDSQGRVKCVACYMCATACPAHCIDIVAAEAPWDDREKYPQSFVIDELRCIFCGMCEEACPCDAIELTSLFDLTGVSREEMVFDKEKLLSVFDATIAQEPMKSPQLAVPGAPVRD